LPQEHQIIGFIGMFKLVSM